MSNTLQSGLLQINLVSGDSFNVTSVLNDQTNRMVERMYIKCDTSGGGGAINIQLPTIAYIGALNFEIIISDTGNNAGTNNINLLPGSGNTINQGTAYAINVAKGGIFITPGTQIDWVAFRNWSVAGSGTVTSFSSGNLSPLFTTSVATATSTPALSFTLSSQVANTVFAGPTSGGVAAPTFRALVSADLPAGVGTVTSFSSGNLSPLFTTSVATATTTPALSFALTNQEARYFFAGPESGSPAAPTFRIIKGDDLPFSLELAGPYSLSTGSCFVVVIGGITYRLGIVT